MTLAQQRVQPGKPVGCRGMRGEVGSEGGGIGIKAFDPLEQLDCAAGGKPGAK